MPLASELVRIVAFGVRTVNVLLEWLMTYAIHSTILIGGLLLLTATPFGKRLLAGHGSWIWRFALVGAFLTASLQSLRTASPLTGTVRVDGDTPSRTMVRMEVNQQVGTIALTPAAASRFNWFSRDGSRHVITSAIEVSPGWPLVALATWLAAAMALLGLFLRARARFLRSIGPRRSGNHTLAGNALRHLLSEGRIGRRVNLTISDRLTSPVALGDDEICLPERALSELDPIRMESILAHELAHLVRRDPTWLTVARVIEAIFFFQPLNIIARRRMQEAAEFASDAWASRRVARPLDLAHCLARVAEWTIAAPRLPVPAMAERRGHVLVRRVQRLTSGQLVHESAPGRGVRLAAVGALVALVLAAPRAAVGADQPAERMFTAPVSQSFNMITNSAPDSMNVVFVRRLDQGGLGARFGRVDDRNLMVRVTHIDDGNTKSGTAHLAIRDVGR
jgi:beta-lactamase regulating signal transducer with metallopeptidase domain